MRAMLMFRQLIGLLDRKLEEATNYELTPEDVLLFAWVEQENGISGSRLASNTGRSRQNIQASLERLMKRGLFEKYESCYRDRSVGWGMTHEGAELWARLADQLHAQDQMLLALGV